MTHLDVVIWVLGMLWFAAHIDDVRQKGLLLLLAVIGAFALVRF